MAAKSFKSSQVKSLLSSLKEDPYVLIFLALYIVLSLRGFYFMLIDGLAWSDMGIQWKTCAYTLRGMSIYSLRASADFVAELGAINAGFHASPWGCLLQNIFYAGFLPLSAAKIYFIIINIIVLLITSYVLYRKASEISLKLGIIVFIMSILSVFFLASIHEGNAGGMICAFLLMAWALCDEHKFISGVLIAFAMVKPQDAVIVCIAFLLLKKFVPVIIAAVIDIAAWFAVSILTNKSMIQLLRDFLFASDRGESGPFPGIFILIFDNFMPAMFASMLFGIIFVFLIIKFLPDDMSEFFKAYPAFMAVTFWCYSFGNDLYVLILPACLCLWLMMSGKRRFFWMLCGIYCFRNSEGSIGKLLTLFTGIIRDNFSKYITRSVFEIGIIIIGIIMCIELRKIFNNKERI